MLQTKTAERTPELIAPTWHTIAVLSVILLVSALGAYLHRSTPLTAHERVFRYFGTIVLQWTLVAFVCWSARQRGIGFAELIGGRWNGFTAVLRDIGVAVAFLLTSYVILAACRIWLRPGHSDGLARLLPHTRAEVAVFLLVAASAGFTEEIIFRGYLQTQLAALSRSIGLGLIFQGVVFGASHGYQGPKRMLLLGIFGCLFGALAKWRKSLRPGMIAHATHDGLVGILSTLIKF